MARYDAESKFYWLQLREDFFDEDSIDWLEEQPNGKEYSLFYLKLCLKSLRTNGILIRRVGNVFIPYDHVKLGELTRTPPDTVMVAMKLLIEIGLVERLEGGELYLKQVEDMVGTQSKGAFKKQQQREKAGLIGGGQGVDKCPPDIEIEKDIEIDPESPPYNPPSRGAADEVEEERKGKKRKILPPDIPESIRGAWDAFVEMRRRISKPMTDYAKHLAYRELCKLSTDPEIQVKILDQSTLNGWQGLFALKEENANTAKPAASQKASGFGNFDPLQAFQNALSRSLGGEHKEGGAKA